MAMVRNGRPTRALAMGLAAALVWSCAPGVGPGQQVGDQGAAASREIISRITGDPPNGAQFGDGQTMTVVSRDFGRGAKAGALVELYYPSYATDHLWDAYVGVAGPTGLKWAHDLKFERQAIAADASRAITVLSSPNYRLSIEDVLVAGTGVHLRRVSLTNLSQVPLQGLALVHHTFFTLNGLPTGDVIKARDGALVQSDDKVAAALVADFPAPAWGLGWATIPTGPKRDARMAAEGNAFNKATEAGPSLTGVDGTLRHPIPDLAPGATTNRTYAIAIAPTGDAALNVAKAQLAAGFDKALADDAALWGERLARRGELPGLTGDARSMRRRALVALAQHVAADGSIIAAPTNLNPPYRLCWPRDGAFVALTLLDEGLTEEALRLAAFLESVQQPHGGWAVNYFPGLKKPLWDFGRRGNEHDQVGVFPWLVAEITKRTGDDAWWQARWPAVQKACRFLLEEQQPDGLLSNCRDLWELSTDGTWTYSNGAALAGLRAGAALAQRVGDVGEAQRFQEAAARLEAGMRRGLVTAQGAWARGRRGSKLDESMEAANLGLGVAAFNAFADTDPIMVATGDQIQKVLGRGGGGVSRYENDQYYDGHPWPVSTVWLARHKLARGDRAAAVQAEEVLTRWAKQTETFMLGEQFDEGQKRWASAFPLAWSEAAALQLTRHLRVTGATAPTAP